MVKLNFTVCWGKTVPEVLAQCSNVLWFFLKKGWIGWEEYKLSLFANDMILDNLEESTNKLVETARFLVPGHIQKSFVFLYASNN